MDAFVIILLYFEFWALSAFIIAGTLSLLILTSYRIIYRKVPTPRQALIVTLSLVFIHGAICMYQYLRFGIGR